MQEVLDAMFEKKVRLEKKSDIECTSEFEWHWSLGGVSSVPEYLQGYFSSKPNTPQNLIDCLVIYPVSAIFQPCDGGDYEKVIGLHEILNFPWQPLRAYSTAVAALPVSVWMAFTCGRSGKGHLQV